MKTRRPTPKKLPSGSWRCQITVDGRRISVTEETPEVAQARAMAIQAGLLEEKEKQKALTLEQAIDGYIAARSEVLSPSTVRGYEFIKRKRFRSLMKQNIHTITKRDMQAAINRETQTGASPTTIAKAYGLVRPALKMYGIDVTGMKLPQQIKKRRAYLQREEIGRLIEAARGDRCEVPILLALWLGLRRSEIMGLHWDCVDFDRGEIVIRRTVVMDKDNKFVEKAGAKNESSQRRISCPDYILDKLRALQKGRTSGPCFRMDPDTIREHIHKLCRENGITDTTTHGLRHTNAAVMRYVGVSDAHAMARGGWTEERTYKGLYSYVFEAAGKSEDDLVNEFFQAKT